MNWMIKVDLVNLDDWVDFDNFEFLVVNFELMELTVFGHGFTQIFTDSATVLR